MKVLYNFGYPIKHYRSHQYKFKTSVHHEMILDDNHALLKFNCTKPVRHGLIQIENSAFWKFNHVEPVSDKFKQVENPVY